MTGQGQGQGQDKKKEEQDRSRTRQGKVRDRKEHGLGPDGTMTKIKQYNDSEKLGEGFFHEDVGGISGLLLGGQASQQPTLQT